LVDKAKVGEIFGQLASKLGLASNLMELREFIDEHKMALSTDNAEKWKDVEPKLPAYVDASQGVETAASTGPRDGPVPLPTGSAAILGLHPSITASIAGSRTKAILDHAQALETEVTELTELQGTVAAQLRALVKGSSTAPVEGGHLPSTLTEGLRLSDLQTQVTTMKNHHLLTPLNEKKWGEIKSVLPKQSIPHDDLDRLLKSYAKEFNENLQKGEPYWRRDEEGYNKYLFTPMVLKDQAKVDKIFDELASKLGLASVPTDLMKLCELIDEQKSVLSMDNAKEWEDVKRELPAYASQDKHHTTKMIEDMSTLKTNVLKLSEVQRRVQATLTALDKV